MTVRGTQTTQALADITIHPVLLLTKLAALAMEGLMMKEETITTTTMTMKTAKMITQFKTPTEMDATGMILTQGTAEILMILISQPMKLAALVVEEMRDPTMMTILIIMSQTRMAVLMTCP